MEGCAFLSGKASSALGPGPASSTAPPSAWIRKDTSGEEAALLFLALEHELFTASELVTAFPVNNISLLQANYISTLIKAQASAVEALGQGY